MPWLRLGIRSWEGVENELRGKCVCVCEEGKEGRSRAGGKRLLRRKTRKREDGRITARVGVVKERRKVAGGKIRRKREVLREGECCGGGKEARWRARRA